MRGVVVLSALFGTLTARRPMVLFRRRARSGSERGRRLSQHSNRFPLPDRGAGCLLKPLPRRPLGVNASLPRMRCR
ncbi:hypothetical protein BC567DRAFT_229780 [Phyllosticta citribraziliensis]